MINNADCMLLNPSLDSVARQQCCCNCKHHHVDYHHCTISKKKSDVGCVCSNPRGWICSGTGRMHSGWSEHGLCECYEKEVV